MPNPSLTTYPALDLYLQPLEVVDLGSSANLQGGIESSLNEEFDHSDGTWENYDAYDPALRAILRNQKHIDIRDFNSADGSAPLSVLDLSQFKMSDLITNQVQTLDDPLHVLVPGEHWTVGVNAILSSYNNWQVLEVTLPSGLATTTTSSVTAAPIDLMTGFANDDFISLSLPNLPAVISPTDSYIDLTSHPTGNFATGPTASLTFQV
jgi:hypothetical protein